MSVRSIGRVWDHSAASGSFLLMLLAIADFADDDGNAYPSVPTLARKCRMKPRNANYIVGHAKFNLPPKRLTCPTGAVLVGR